MHRSMKQVFADLDIADVTQLLEIMSMSEGDVKHYEDVFNWTIEKNRKFDKKYDDIFDDNKIEKPEFKHKKAIGKAGEKAVLDRFVCLQDNTTKNLKNTDLISKHNGTLVEVKTSYSPLCANHMVDGNRRKKFINVNIFDKNSRPGSLLRTLMYDLNAYVIFHIHEFEYDWVKRDKALNERRNKKPITVQHSSTHFKIYKIRDLMKRFFKLSEKHYLIENATSTKLELVKYRDLELSETEFVKEMSTKAKKS